MLAECAPSTHSVRTIPPSIFQAGSECYVCVGRTPAAWMRPILQMRNDLILDDLIQDDLIQEITIVDCRTYSCTRGTCHFRCLQGAISRDLLDLGIVTGARDIGHSATAGLPQAAGRTRLVPVGRLVPRLARRWLT